MKDKWLEVQEMMVKMYSKLKNKDRDKVLAELMDADFESLILDEFGLGGELERVAGEYIGTLKGMESFANVDESILQGLIKMDMDAYKTKIIDAATIMRKQTMEAVLGDLTEDGFKMSLESVGFQPHQAEAMVNDGLRQFSRNVTNEMANKMPTDTLYIWDGPVDDRTSDDCLQLISAGPMTQGEFESVMSGAFTFGTHFNCRHQPERFTEKAQFMGKQSDAQIKANDES